MSGLDEPLAAFEEFSAQHSQRVEEYLGDLVSSAGVDAEANTNVIAKISLLDQDLGEANRQKRKLLAATSSLVLVALMLVGSAALLSGFFWLLLVPAALLLAGGWKQLKPRWSNNKSESERIELERSAEISVAKAQMAPVNSALRPEVAHCLVQQVLPELHLDRFVSSHRFKDLSSNFGLNSGSRYQSTLDVQSGQYSGHPFVIRRYREFHMGTRKYEGSLKISWTERIKDKDGKKKTVHRSEILKATVEKAYPEYRTLQAFFFGSSVSPQLRFSRQPSKFSRLRDSSLERVAARSSERSLERKARRAVKKDGEEFTLMANSAFESQFGALDRNDEIQFRRFFSALSQQQMVELLEDRSIGFGDDFSFSMRGGLIEISADHFSDFPFRERLKSIESYSLAEFRENFLAYHREFFRQIYFTLAPIWAISSHHDPRAEAKGSEQVGMRELCSWDHEVLTNHVGANKFEHRESKTEKILKTKSQIRSNGTEEVIVTAHSFKTTDRVEEVRVRGGDGKWHQVPVKWVEYTPVERSTYILVSALADRRITSDTKPRQQREMEWGEALKHTDFEESKSVTYRGVAAALPPKDL